MQDKPYMFSYYRCSCRKTREYCLWWTNKCGLSGCSFKPGQCRCAHTRRGLFHNEKSPWSSKHPVFAESAAAQDLGRNSDYKNQRRTVLSHSENADHVVTGLLDGVDAFKLNFISFPMQQNRKTKSTIVSEFVQSYIQR